MIVLQCFALTAALLTDIIADDVVSQSRTLECSFAEDAFADESKEVIRPNSFKFNLPSEVTEQIPREDLDILSNLDFLVHMVGPKARFSLNGNAGSGWGFHSNQRANIQRMGKKVVTDFAIFKKSDDEKLAWKIKGVAISWEIEELIATGDRCIDGIVIFEIPEELEKSAFDDSRER